MFCLARNCLRMEHERVWIRLGALVGTSDQHLQTLEERRIEHDTVE